MMVAEAGSNMVRNPGVVSIVRFLRKVERFSRAVGATYTRLSGEQAVGNYIKWCLRYRLIEILGEVDWKGPRKMKFYVLTDRGRTLLQLFEEEEEDP